MSVVLYVQKIGRGCGSPLITFSGCFKVIMGDSLMGWTTVDYAGDNKGRFVQWDIVLAFMWVVRRKK